ncbi:CRAL-TRIO domain-containing protein F28H7.8 [Toxocara canis]|uniref:CRAL-TRIO domain-containing protein F28H7.8 n=1 Tax=Toxocara canis TaxID=6265 RepID=A0A0B2VIP9_TOXCA|nr:CRAL-TRIO domain-containing protein F28H7.8 [Toxocara canis]
MAKRPSTYFGEPLSAESKKLVNEVRLKINQPIHPNFDNDFNVYRFVLSAERINKKDKEVVDAAAKALNNHLRIRKAMRLDTTPDMPFDDNPIFRNRLLPLSYILPYTDNCNRLLWYLDYASINVEDTTPDMPFDDNPIFRNRLLPLSYILPYTDNCNRLLWYLDYASINVEAIAHTIRSSESIKYQFLQFEHMLRRVNKQEEKTGCLSGIRHIIDLNGYEINPFTMFFVTNGNLSYYSQLLHFENYPDLVTPMEMVNIPKWIHVPYRMVRTMMPASFNDRFRLHDENFLTTLQQDINIEHIPQTLGGQNEKIRSIPAEKITSENFWKPTNLELLSTLETFHISPRKNRQIYVDVTEASKQLSWYYITDGDIYFGVFYEPPEETSCNNIITTTARHEKEVEHENLEMVYPWLKLAAKIVHESDRPPEETSCNNIITTTARHEKEVEHENLEMVYPWLKLAAKIVHESDRVECTRPGRYWLIFCNKISWLQRRTIHLTMQLSDGETTKRCHTDGTFSSAEPFEVPHL